MGGCGATLVSSKHVITAAHCITMEKVNTRQPEDMAPIKLGVHNKTAVAYCTNCLGDNPYISDEDAAGLTHLPFKTVGIAKVIVHPEWSGNTKFKVLSLCYIIRSV